MKMKKLKLLKKNACSLSALPLVYDILHKVEATQKYDIDPSHVRVKVWCVSTAWFLNRISYMSIHSTEAS